MSTGYELIVHRKNSNKLFFASGDRFRWVFQAQKVFKITRQTWAGFEIVLSREAFGYCSRNYNIARGERLRKKS